MSAATDKGVRLRTARKDGRCANATAHMAGNAPGCERLILAGDRYMEGDRNETAGGFGFDRICMGCYARDYAPKAPTDKGVLAVMDIDIAPTYDTPQDWHNALREARAAVAELIEADKEYDAAREAHKAAHGRGRHHNIASTWTRFDAAVVRRAAALARCNGGAL